MDLPVRALYDKDDQLLATVRAGTTAEARELFKDLPEWARPRAARVGSLPS